MSCYFHWLSLFPNPRRDQRGDGLKMPFALTMKCPFHGLNFLSQPSFEQPSLKAQPKQMSKMSSSHLIKLGWQRNIL